MIGEALNPGSFNNFREKLGSDIPPQEAVALYTRALAAFREAVTADSPSARPVSDFMPRPVEESGVMGEGGFEPLVDIRHADIESVV